jgi:hypothetical protein
MTQLMLVTGFNRQLGLSDELFALADTALLTVLGQVAFMPLLVLAARICPEVGQAADWLSGGLAGWLTGQGVAPPVGTHHLLLHARSRRRARTPPAATPCHPCRAWRPPCLPPLCRCSTAAPLLARPWAAG